LLAFAVTGATAQLAAGQQTARGATMELGASQLPIAIVVAVAMQS